MKHMPFTNKIIIKLLYFAFIIFSGKNSSLAQEVKFVFKPGEVVKYDVYYQFAGVWLKAAKVNFSAQKSTYQNKEAWHFVSTGQTLPSYDWFFKVDDKFESYADYYTLLPFYGFRDSYEGGFIVKEYYYFDYQQRKIISDVMSSDVKRKIDTFKMGQQPVYDLLTAIYLVRNLDFSKMKINETYYFWALVFGKIYPLYIRYLGKESIVLQNQKTYDCLKFSAKVVPGTIFRHDEAIEAWVTDNEVKIAVRIKAKIIVGSVYADLVE